MLYCLPASVYPYPRSLYAPFRIDSLPRLPELQPLYSFEIIPSIADLLSPSLASDSSVACMLYYLPALVSPGFSGSAFDLLNSFNACLL